MQHLDQNLTNMVDDWGVDIATELRSIGDTLDMQLDFLDSICAKQDRYTDEVSRSNRQAGDLLRTVRNVAGVLGSLALARGFIQMSDSMTSINAKLSMINDGAQSNAELQDMIYQSAQRSRAAYESTANMVARLGMNAKEAFNSNAELVQFAENLNKQFTIAGATQEEMASATLQMTQALSSSLPLRERGLKSGYPAGKGLPCGGGQWGE